MMTLIFCMALQEEIEQVRTKTAFTLDEGEFEVDLVGSFLRFEERDESSVLLEAEYGITDWLLVEIEVPFEWANDERGWGEFEVEVKAALPRGFTFVEIAFGAGAAVDPDGDAEFEVFAAFSRDFGWLRAHLQVGLEAADEARPEYAVNLAFDVRPWKEISVLLALNGEIEEDAEWCLVPGFEVRFEEPDLQFGVGFPIGLSDDAEEWGVIVDVEIEF